MRVSFIATVFNEEKTVRDFFGSLFRQTKMPDEIIIIDGGSTDSTLSMISDFTSEESRSVPRHHPRWVNKNIKFKILRRSGSTIAQGRNYGIKKATGDVIAMSDAGCVLHKDWLEKITKPFIKEDADIVAGFYRMTGSAPLQKALAVYFGIPPKKFDENNFLPSTRSIAFKKSLWQKIGGFDKFLDKAGEDTLFNYQAVKLGAKFVRVKDALVDWEIPNSLWEGIRKFYIYAKGDVQTGIWWHPTQRTSTHNLKIAAIFIRYLVGVTLLVLSVSFNWLLYIVIFGFLFYVFWSIWKMRDVATDLKTRLCLPIVQIGSDIAVVVGTTSGVLKKLNT